MYSSPVFSLDVEQPIERDAAREHVEQDPLRLEGVHAAGDEALGVGGCLVLSNPLPAALQRVSQSEGEDAEVGPDIGDDRLRPEQGFDDGCEEFDLLMLSLIHI